MSKITGIGGVFLNISGDTKKLLNWYHEVLGLDITEYGINFLSPNKCTLITFDNKESSETVLNFTVNNLEEFLQSLKNKNVKIIQDIKAYEYGKFAQIEDILGNIVELWEPNDDNYKNMVKKEIDDFNKKL
ncbi:VOC family protein [Alkaliphilus hydrothermalis]|uniref:Lactoylglutathione lyase n=1 Tax=Alkaliphilus hydrothermalis TaxID=1482730 RepID=A0ABS2NPK2_9FIRM|nr:VOC family protein [Alkaliphilus hydrothermalis]MBM7614879.1 lactoylglutathione lyase [Alkaliphilus hydrothermalis]